MKLNYAYRNIALNSFLGFLKEDFVYDFFGYFQSEGDFRPSIFMGKEFYQRHVDDSLTHFNRALEDFESEIMQVSMTSTQQAINFYFEELNDMMSWVTIVDSDKIRIQFDDWNARKIAEFSAEVETESGKYFQSDDRSRPHLEKYMEREGGLLGFLTLAGSLAPQYREVTNYNYYCVKSTPDVLDMQYFQFYLTMLDQMKTKLESLVGKYMDLYRRNKIVSAAQAHFENVTLTLPELPASGIEKIKLLPEAAHHEKIKWNGTPEEFVEAFAPLIEKRKIYLHHKLKPDTQPIARLLYQAFEIHQVGKSIEITENTLVSYFKKYFAEKK